MADASVPGSDWERPLSTERHLQAVVPGTVLVGGTATALHARRRVSLDGDHVVSELRDRFDQVLPPHRARVRGGGPGLADLEAAAGWALSKASRPARNASFTTAFKVCRRFSITRSSRAATSSSSVSVVRIHQDAIPLIH